MFRNLPRYEQYEPTESPWLGDLPSHWYTQRTKTLLVERSQKGYPHEPLLAATQSQGVILKSDYGSRTVTATKDLHLLKLVEVGDFVISLRSFQGGIERCHHRGIISPAYTILTTKSDEYREYLTFLFKSIPFVDSLTLAVTGIREGQNVDYATLAVDQLPVPTPEEQASIAKYLAHANARISKAIAAKRRLIALFEEQTDFVSREVLSGRSIEGIDLDSGDRVPWLGSVPVEWGALPLKRLAKLRSGAGFPVDRQGVMNQELPFFRVSDMGYPGNEVFLDFCESTVSRAESAELGAVIFEPESICFPKVGGALLTNKRRILKRSSCLDNNLMGATFFGLEVDYAYEIMKLVDMSDVAKPGPVPAVGQGDVGRIVLPVPPKEVQHALVEALRLSRQESARAAQVASREIALLQEFRMRLIADVVTGQVDVRKIAATLPDTSTSSASASLTTDVELVDVLGEGEE